MQYSNLKEKLFMESNSGKECISHLEEINGTTISKAEADKIANSYAMKFYQETKFRGAFAYICNMYIPIVLFKKYNIKVLDYTTSLQQSTNQQHNTYYTDRQYVINEKKTAPTLIDGWIIYIIIMLALSIFNERLIGWIFTTIVFIIWRKNEIKKYN